MQIIPLNLDSVLLFRHNSKLAYFVYTKILEERRKTRPHASAPRPRFKGLLQDTVGQIKQVSEGAMDQND